MRILEPTPPNNIDAERAVLGAIILNSKESMPVAMSVLGKDLNVFYVETHRDLYEAALQLFEKGSPVDEVTLIEQLTANNKFNFDSSSSYVAGLTNAVPTSSSIEYYSRIVLDMATQRQAIDGYELLSKQLLIKEIDTGKYIELATQLGRDLAVKAGTDENKLTSIDMNKIVFEPAPDLDCVFNGNISVPKGSTSVTVAAGGRGKSMMGLILTLSLATGKPLFNSFQPAQGPRKVVMISAEDPADEYHRRIQKIIREYGMSEDDCKLIAENVIIYPGRSFPIFKEDFNVCVITQWYHKVARIVEEAQPVGIFFDPLASFFALNENSNSLLASAMNHIRGLTDLVKDGAALFVNHHTSKEREDEITSGMGRGASAIRDAARSLLGLVLLSKEECTKYGVSNPLNFFKCELAKVNWTAAPTHAIYFQRCTGTNGGVLREVDLEVQAKEIDVAINSRLAKAFAEMIGSNDENLTIYEILSGKSDEKKYIRVQLKKDFKSRATIKCLEAAIKYAEETELIIVEDFNDKGPPKRVPRQNTGQNTGQNTEQDTEDPEDCPF